MQIHLMGLFDDLFKKADIPGKITIAGKEYQINPDAMVFSQRALDKYQLGDYQNAVLDFTRAINAQPSNQNFYLMRGTAYEDMGNDVLAEADFKKSLEIDSTGYVSAYRLGMVYFRRKDLENAIRWLRVSYAHSPDGDMEHLSLGTNNIFFVAKKVIAGNLGHFLTQLKKYDDGFKYLDEAMTIDPKYSNPYMAKGMALVQIGKLKEGILYLKKAVALGNVKAASSLKFFEELAQQEEAKNGKDIKLDFVFHSFDHLRYENGQHVSGPHGGAPRAIKVEPNISGTQGYTVTMFNTQSGQAVVQMAPKQMRLENLDKEKIRLKGYGRDQLGASFADYGLTIYHTNGKVIKCVLHMFDRNVDIEYMALPPEM